MTADRAGMRHQTTQPMAPAITGHFKLNWPGFALDAQLNLPGAGITALFGRSGSGKTTLLRCLAGLQHAPGAQLVVNGEVWQSQAGTLPTHRRALGYVFQEAGLLPHLSVYQNLVYGLRRTTRDRSKTLRNESRLALEQAIELLGIGMLLSRRPADLSGGERQRVAIARALAGSPRLLLMDEPLAALDAARKAELLPYIAQLPAHYQIPMVYVSHAIDEVIALADHLLLIDNGQVVRSGPLLDVIADAELGPLLGRFEAGSVLDCHVLRHDAMSQQTTLGFMGGQLLVPLTKHTPGQRLRVRLRARDVSLALTEPQDISISNRLPGRITALHLRDGPYVDVSVALDGAASAAKTGELTGSVIRALVTQESARRLKLQPGLAVWALIKTVAMDSRSVGYGQRLRAGDASATNY